MKPKPKETKLLLNLMDGERHRHRVALVTEEGEWNQHEPNSGMARMFVVMLLIHVVLIGGIIIYDFMGDDTKPQQTVTQATRALSTGNGLPMASPEVVTAQALAAANTEQFDNYEMRSGDSIKSIAGKFGSTEAEITRLNMIDKGLQIGPGTMLRVPRQAVPSAIPVNPKTLKPMMVTEDVTKAVLVVRDQPPATKVPSEAVKPSEAPASLSAATMSPISLLAPNEAPPAASSLVADANTSAIASAPPASAAAALPPPTKPNVVSLLQENAPKVEASKPEAVRPRDRDEPRFVTKAEAKPLVKPIPVPPPSQMLKKISEAPPATKKAEPTKKVVADAPSKAVAKAGTARTHTLKSGETLYRLASKYGVSVAAIQKANNIKNPNAMREGMKLAIPAK
ncbi:LysM peptidoglycan-binding domain-containing protein [Prosthecobacter sp.]|uniref:LysM peptidoglycan-binding domain-containing protein n=1 Tax=Prosthecobacter sp. TaxID=1965333 RepID=UPI002488896C|nr:LysM peptidoglycan-binding domain-containing protein [Prosthecobacter sp.]MDI1314351.1 LysM peptidoglycan-binding domain-containing protein [Prosthecobacter sp.]